MICYDVERLCSERVGDSIDFKFYRSGRRGWERKKERVACMAAAVAGEVLLIVNERFREMAT